MKIVITIISGQWALVKVETGLSIWNKVSFRSPGLEDWNLARDWSKDPWCLVKLSQVAGKHTIVAWLSTAKTDNDSNQVLVAGGEVLVAGNDFVGPSLFDQGISVFTPIPEILRMDAVCNQVLAGHGRALQAIFREMFFEPCPVGASRILCIGDMNNQAGCQEHPSGSHTNGTDFDCCYYVKGPDNLTQWFGTQYTTKIFTEGGEVDPAKFDVARNIAFWRRLHAAFPECSIRVDKRIGMFVLENGGRGLPLHLDLERKYKHNTHAHVQLGGVIDWSKII